MISEAELLTNDFTFIPAQIYVKDNVIVMKKPVLEYLEYCKKNDVKNIYYQYEYYDKDQYVITDELIDKATCNKKEFAYCKKWAKEQNESLEKYDFSIPKKILLGASVDSLLVGYAEINNWLENIEKAEDRLYEYIDEHEEELLDMDNKNIEKELLSELKQQLLDDEAFRYAKNKSLRISYVNEFIKKKKNEKYLQLITHIKNPYDKTHKMCEYIEIIYAEYKNKCQESNIRIGMELPK